jgi:hypothetical protein
MMLGYEIVVGETTCSGRLGVAAPLPPVDTVFPSLLAGEAILLADLVVCYLLWLLLRLERALL